MICWLVVVVGKQHGQRRRRGKAARPGHAAPCMQCHAQRALHPTRPSHPKSRAATNLEYNPFAPRPRGHGISLRWTCCVHTQQLASSKQQVRICQGVACWGEGGGGGMPR